MADIIQSQINVVHTVEGGKPTEDKIKPTETTATTTPQEESGTDDSKLRNDLMSASVHRRVVNYTIAAVDRAVANHYDKKIFQENLYGDMRTAKVLQIKKQNYASASNVAKATAGAFVTSLAMGNPLVLMLQGYNILQNGIANSIQRADDARHFREKTQNDLYVSQKRQDRLIVGVYNRR